MIWGVGVPGEGLPAGLASIPPTPATLHLEVGVPDDVALPDEPSELTVQVWVALPQLRIGGHTLPCPLRVDPILLSN